MGWPTFYGDHHGFRAVAEGDKGRGDHWHNGEVARVGGAIIEGQRDKGDVGLQSGTGDGDPPVTGDGGSASLPGAGHGDGDVHRGGELGRAGDSQAGAGVEGTDGPARDYHARGRGCGAGAHTEEQSWDRIKVVSNLWNYHAL